MFYFVQLRYAEKYKELVVMRSGHLGITNIYSEMQNYRTSARLCKNCDRFARSRN